jgi:PBP1b-binding outer membrane lipoprotein LpoB
MLNIIFWLCLVFTSAALVYIKGILNHEDMAKQIEAYTENKAKENLAKMSQANRFMKATLAEEKTLMTQSSSVFITLDSKKHTSHNVKSDSKGQSINLDSYKLEAFPLSDITSERVPEEQLRCA